MRNFTNNELQFLVNNGFLSPKGADYYIDIHPDSPKRSKYNIPIGYPVVFDKNEFHKKNENFPVELLKEYHVKINNSSFYNDSYFIPNGIQDLTDFNVNNKDLTSKLQEWISISEKYINSDFSEDEKNNFLLQLFQKFRELFFIYLLDIDLKMSPISKDFFVLFNNGYFYRHVLFNDLPKSFELINNSCIPIFNSILDSIEDLHVFEKEAINFKLTNYRFCNIPRSLLNLWSFLTHYKYKNQPYKEVSPFFNNFKLYLYKNTPRAAKDIINLFEWLNKYDFSLTKDIYLDFFKNSSQKKLITYLEKKLKINNSLPQISQNLLLNKESFIIYKETLNFNFEFIKTHVDNNVYAAECLIAIVKKSFIQYEKDCIRFDWFYTSNPSSISISLETLQHDKIENLNNKLIDYIKCVISSEFLTKDMINLLTKHSGNSNTRRTYEDDNSVMIQYNTLKNKFLLKETLENKLQSKNVQEKITKI